MNYDIHKQFLIDTAKALIDEAEAKNLLRKLAVVKRWFDLEDLL
jgi:hypothetical protein